MPIVFADGIETEIAQEEYDAMIVKVPDTEGYIRNERNFRMSQTDVWALSDRTMTAEQTAYRQALRDITSQEGFPTNITWPTKP
jgi:hypothetical protein|tara:strand:+ start:672 stop:923 length:252 start_codon:yes stop_codon:yes gene_type:complete